MHEVVDESDLFLHEGLGVTHAGQQAIVARRREGPLANLFLRHEEAAAGELVAVLRAIGQQRAQPASRCARVMSTTNVGRTSA